jgi:hypothetical protein
MEATIQLPQAFSVRDEHEFYPMQHIMARLNPNLLVEQVATGRHVNGNYTVLWGLVYLEGHLPKIQDIEGALEEAGYDFSHNKPIAPPEFLEGGRSRKAAMQG